MSVNKSDLLLGLGWLALGVLWLGDQTWVAIGFMIIGALSLLAAVSPRVHDYLVAPIGRRK